MAHERLKDAALPRALSDVVADLADLFQKEVRLARAELTDKLTAKATAGIWMSVAGVLGFVALLLVLQSVIFAIASYGIALHWSSLIVAAVVAVVAVAFYLKGHSNAQEEIAPRRTINQIKRDISTAKEQLT